MHVEDAEGLGIGRAGAAALPGIARDQELVARYVERIEGNLEQLALAGIELGVDQQPRLAVLVPVFGDPMVEELARLEIAAEAAARAGPHTGATQHGDVEQGEVPAYPDLPPVGRARFGEGPRIARHDLAHDLLDRADMRLGVLAVAQAEAIGRRD